MKTVQYRNDVPLILVSNDDGVESPGLLAAVKAVLPLGHVIVAAPSGQQTARGRSMVGDPGDSFHPTRLDVSDSPPFSLEAFHIDASPALAVRHAIAVLCEGRIPDLVVSGINFGENVGNNITISGTVGAAIQGAVSGVPSIAASRQTDMKYHFSYGSLDWTDATRVTSKYAARLLALTFDGARTAATPAGALPFDVLKIDVPESAPPGTEERVTRLSRSSYFASRIEEPKRTTPIGESRTFVAIDPEKLDRADDIYAVAIDEVVSLTPLSFDLSAPIDESAAILDVPSIRDPV